jgi:mono/diheme cytochrome c family protein
MKKVLFIVAALFLLAGYVSAQTAGWTVPDKYKTMKPAANLADKSVIANGKDLWAKNCKSCHGAAGLGDGPKAAMLKTPIVSFADPKFQAQTNGEIYYKTMTGKGEMPAYEKKIPTASDQWSLVAYIRTLKK